MASGDVKVYVVTDKAPNVETCSSTFTAEDLCVLMCKKYKIPPLTRTLFGLRVKGTDYFLKDNSQVLSTLNREYELRIRFKVPRLSHLITLDEITYDYYFQQARDDVNENRIPEIRYEDHKKEMLGLGITDMYRAILEDKIALEDVVKSYKRYIPKVILRRHGLFPKKYAHDYLRRICMSKASHDVYFVKSQYLQQLYLLAPNYLAEEYKGVWLKNGDDSMAVTVQVAPFHNQQAGLRLYNKSKEEWAHICTIEEIVYLTRNCDTTLEISRRGTPLFLEFRNEDQLSSFISICDGYYRLMVKWTFNLSKDDETPSLKELHRLKCHGPVGGAFSYRKLEEKRSKKHGCYIIRQCQDDYNVFYLDVCTKNSTTETYKLEFRGHCYVFNYEEYSSIEALVARHHNPGGRIYLSECIPPSEYDKSQLLLCGEPQKKGVRIDAAELQEILRDNRSPRCLNTKDILLYTGTEKVGPSGITATHKALWVLDETKKLEVAFKTLQRDKSNEYLKEFIELANKWACVSSSAVVRLYGVTLGAPAALVLEYLPHGPFDDYLRKNPDKIVPIHLKKVAAYLARALWDLSEAGVVHGYIRCRRLLLASIDQERIVVKLAGPSLHVYNDDDVHWIPVEFYSDMSLARRSVAGDIWAFATTLWELFSGGTSPARTNPVLTAKSYLAGSRLHKPSACPGEVWSLVKSCWQQDPHLRARPQEIMRDMNHMLHKEYTPLPPGGYTEVDERPFDPKPTDGTIPSDRLTLDPSDVGSNKSLISDRISDSNSSINGTATDSDYNDNRSTLSMGSLPAFDAPCFEGNHYSGAQFRPPSPDEFNPSEPRLMESIVSQGVSYLVTLNKRIGSGNYGDVYRGVMERDMAESHKQDVAIKKLKRRVSEQGSMMYEAFTNELEVMKSLQHVNVVEVLGYDWGGRDLLIVMEYLEEGALTTYLHFQGDKLKYGHLLKYALDIATGMDHVSAKNVVHRDLAARNILVVNKHHVKISDFGLARIIPKEENHYRVRTERHLPINWYAPESAVKPWDFSTKSDVWSYGVTVWEIFTRARQEVPRFDLDCPEQRANSFPPPAECPGAVYRDIMQQCWRLAPAARPSFLDLVYKCKQLLAEYK